MAGADTGAAVARLPAAGSSVESAPLSNASTAIWVCLIPCAVASALAIAFLGPPLGDLLYPAHSPYTFLSSFRRSVHPERTEQLRYILSLGAPVLLSLATYAVVRRQPRMAPAVVSATRNASQVLLVAFVVACMIGQYTITYGPIYSRNPHLSFRKLYFTPATLIVAAAIAAGIVAAARSERVRTLVGGWLRESRTRRIAALAIAVIATAIWMLQGISTDASLTGAEALEGVRYHVGFHLDETFAVLNGLTPLVNFTSQYASLWPYVAALPMLAFGKTLLVFSIAMCTLTVLALLALYGVLRRATRSSVVALLLFLPVLATGLFLIESDPVRRFTPGTYFATFHCATRAPASSPG